MSKWDQDIHRIQEIQQLLEDRQRYFCGHLSTSCYKLDSNGNPLFFPKLHSKNKGPDSNEPSLGHSVKANFGSTDTASDTQPPLNTTLQGEGGGKHGESGALSDDSSDGNCADHSQNESSDASGVDGKDVAKKKVMRKSPKLLRKWVAKNLEVASAPSIHRKSNASSTIDNVDSRKSSILRFKSVSFDNESAVVDVQAEKNELDYEDLLYLTNPTRSTKKKKAPNPIKLLRRRSWILKAEMASRLNEDTNGMNLNKVISGLTKSSISHAREKLKKAERSLRATVKNEHKIPVCKKQLKATDQSKNKPTAVPAKPKPVNKRVVSRLALRQQEEAVKSDLNLREAFALIKIDPDPLLNLASTESESKSGSKTVSTFESPLPKQQTEGKFHRNCEWDDSKTSLSLQRLTKLSIQHLQRKQSWIPSNVQPLLTQKGNKEMQRTLKNMTGKSGKCEGDKDSSKLLFESSRRKSSVATIGIQQLAHTTSRRRSKEFRSDRTSNLPSTGLAAPKNQDRKGFKLDGESHRVQALDKLVGTVI